MDRLKNWLPGKREEERPGEVKKQKRERRGEEEEEEEDKDFGLVEAGSPLDVLFGAIFGQAMGDAHGLATEFLNKITIAQIYPDQKINFGDFQEGHPFAPDPHRVRWKTGEWTDDTDQAILVIQALMDHGTELSIAFAARLKGWTEHGFQERRFVKRPMGIGMTVGSCLRHPEFLTLPHKASEDIWKAHGENLAANGAVMRTSPLAFPGGFHRLPKAGEYPDPSDEVQAQDERTALERVARDTVAVARVTHADPRCVVSSLAVSLTIALILRRGRGVIRNRARFIDLLLGHLGPYIPEGGGDELIRHLKVDRLEDLQLDEAQSIGYTYKCLGAGFWALFCEEDLQEGQEAEHFRRLIRRLTLEGGDSDTNGAVAGALLGAKFGFKALPQDWVKYLPQHLWLWKLVREFEAHLTESH